MKVFYLTVYMAVFAGLSGQTQRMGVNTNNPTATLDVQTTGNSGQTSAFSVSNANQDTLLLLRDNGRLGIGTTQPQAPLDVQTSGNVAARFSAPVEGQPAVNTNELVTLGQLQAVSAGGQGGTSSASTATQWSTGTQSSVNLFSSMMFCRTLTEGGFSDWYLPSLNDIIKLISDSSIPLPSYANGFYWLSPLNPVTNSNNSLLISVNGPLTNVNSWSFANTSNVNSHNAFCVR